MKKFLSLVLALIMTMSLVTISAGATEYRDLTDKDEIQYEEAVAVLNRIGVITGYEDGSFRPETELTRGAAAKIIVSLMIGPEAASALPNNASSYPDVPAGHTFAGVIGYCKTAGYISGYGDGTFKPANPLTGYAFAKMLLGAVGYKGNIEGFVDTGWTMNVARIGNVAGLFDRISFDGAKAVTRDEACQLALNTLKATMVDYGSANTVVSSSGEVLTVQGSKAVYVTSNNRDINANINRRVISATNNELTLEFGEEHFKDLRLEHDRYDPAYDVYGHPSNEWSYKKVTIGTFKLPADYTFTKQMAHIEDTVATKEKALGLRGYDTYSTDHRGGYVNWSTAASSQYAASPFADATQIHINGWEARVYNEAYKQTEVPSGEKADIHNGVWYSYDARSIGSANKTLAPTLSEICDLTDNGVTVEVYVCPVDADFITDVVVTRTQLMEVDRIASDYVELDTISSDSEDPYKDGPLTEIAGYNDYSLQDGVVSVKDNNYDAYNVLKDLKSGDEVAIIPYTSDNGKTWEVGEAYVPETVSGALTNVDIYNTKSKADGNAIAITVGGTTYPIAQWNKDMREIDATKIRSTKKDVTLLLDKMGNALLAKDVGNSNAWIVVGDYYQATLSSGRVGWYVHGWTIKGDEVDLELGSIRGAAEKYAPGELVKYQVAETGDGEYELVKPIYSKDAAKAPTAGSRVLKNGQLSSWTEPQGGTKTIDGKKYQTGEGIYNIAQYASKGGVAEKYKIESRNTLLPLEFYATDVLNAGTPITVEADKDHPVVHFDYKNATATPNVLVGTDAETAAATNTTYCGELKTPDNDDQWYVDKGRENEWTYLSAPYDGVKFIYVGFDSSNGNVEVINVLDGVQNVAYDELKQINRWWKNVGTNDGDWVASPAEAYVDKDGKVKAVVIKSDSAEANLKDLMIITDNRGTHTSTRPAIGAEAPTSGDYNTYQYVSGEDGFKEEKTGYFDKKLDVGTVITGSLQSNGIIRAKVFHATDYTNRNPDGIYVKGIEALKTQEQVKSKTAFYVGVDTDEVQYLGTGVRGGGTKLKDRTDVDILSNFEVMGYDYGFVGDESYKGLIKVNSATQFLDLRDGRPGDIDELDDLFDSDKCDKDTVELKLLLNGNKSSDGFRTAYVVMILEANPGKSTETKPDFTIDAVSDGDGDFTADKKSFETYVGETVTLSPDWAEGNWEKMNSGVKYAWTIKAVDPKTNTAKLSSYTAEEVTFTPKKTGTYEVTLTITNPRVNKDQAAVVAKTLTIVVKDEAEASTNVVWADSAVKNGAEIGSSNAIVSGSKVVVTFLMDAPKWASGTAAVKYNVKVNGKQVNATAVTETLTVGATGLMTGQTANATNGIAVSSGSAVEIEITEVTYAKVKVQVMENDVDVTKKWTVPADVAVGNATAITVNSVEYASTDSTAANAPTAKITGGVKSEVALAMTFNTNKWTNTAATADVKGDGYVVITVDTSKLVPSYTITLNDGAGTAPNNNDGKNITDGSLTLADWGITTADKTATVTVAGTTLTAKEGVPFNPGNITIKLGTAPTSGYEYTVTIPKLNNAKVVLTNTTGDDATALGAGAVTLTADMLITKDDIQIECTKQPLAIEEASWTSTTMTIVFNQKVGKDTAETFSGSSSPYTLSDAAAGAVIGDAKIQADGKTVVLTISGAELAIPNAGNSPKVAVDGAKINDLDGNAFSAITADEITITAGGTTSIA